MKGPSTPVKQLTFDVALVLAIIVFAVAALTGCRKDQKDPPPNETIVEVSVPYECGEPPGVDPVAMRPVAWRVLTVEGVKLFTLTGAMYEALMSNLTDVAASAKQKNAVTQFYADCIERARKADAARRAARAGKPDPP